MCIFLLLAVRIIIFTIRYKNIVMQNILGKKKRSSWNILYLNECKYILKCELKWAETNKAKPIIGLKNIIVLQLNIVHKVCISYLERLYIYFCIYIFHFKLEVTR